MSRDSRLYNIIADLASDNNVRAVDTFNQMLEERITDNVRDATRAFQYTGPSNVQPNSEV